MIIKIATIAFGISLTASCAAAADATVLVKPNRTAVVRTNIAWDDAFWAHGSRWGYGSGPPPNGAYYPPQVSIRSDGRTECGSRLAQARNGWWHRFGFCTAA